MELDLSFLKHSFIFKQYHLIEIYNFNLQCKQFSQWFSHQHVHHHHHQWAKSKLFSQVTRANKRQTNKQANKIQKWGKTALTKWTIQGAFMLWLLSSSSLLLNWERKSFFFYFTFSVDSLHYSVFRFVLFVLFLILKRGHLNKL